MRKQLKRLLRQKDYSKWETQKGEILLIKDMTTSHIINCMNMITRSYLHQYTNLPTLDVYWTCSFGQGYLNYFSKELKRRSCMYDYEHSKI